MCEQPRTGSEKPYQRSRLSICSLRSLTHLLGTNLVDRRTPRFLGVMAPPLDTLTGSTKNSNAED